MTERRPRFKAVTVDAGGTLFQVAKPVGHIYAEVAARHGCQADGAALDRRFRQILGARGGSLSATEAVSTLDDERAFWRDVVRDVFGPAGGPEDFEGFFDELHGVFADPGAWRVFPEAAGALEGLRRAGIRLAVLSNWDARLEELCRALGLRHLFEHVVTSSAVGAAKPSGRMFRAALDRLGAEPGETLHVGDSLRDDVWGAAQAGVTPVWLRRPGPGAGQGEPREGEGEGEHALEEIVGRAVDVIPDLAALAGIAC